MKRAATLIALLAACVCSAQALKQSKCIANPWGFPVLTGGGCSGAVAQLLALGDAITLSTGLSPTYPSSLGAALGLSPVNAGVAGDTVSAMKTRYDAAYHVPGQVSRCTFLGGETDIITNGATASATYTTASALLDEMRSDGCKPLVVLPTPAKGATGWTVPRLSEYEIFRRSLQTYCTTNVATTTCAEESPVLTNGDVLPKLSVTYGSGDALTLNQTGANLMAKSVARAIPSGTPLYSSTTHDVTTTSPLASNALTYCLVATEAPNATWDANEGLISIGPFNTANSVNFYRYTGGPGQASIWAIWMFDASNAGTNQGSNASPFPRGYAVYQRSVAAFCANNGQGTIWVDGILVKGPFAIPTNQTLPGTLTTGANAYGGASTNILSLCIAGPTGAVNADVTLAVQNSCGQFAPRSAFPVQGGVLPVSGALVVAAFGDSITELGASVVRPWPQKYNALIGTGYNVINDGHQGNTVANIKSTYDATYHGHGAIQRCIFLGGINDIFNGAGATGAATFTTASALLDEMRADGCKPIVVMPTPAKNTSLGWTAGKQTEYDSYRSSLSGYCTTNAATTTCVETYGAGPTGMGDGTSPPQLYATYDSGDHTHPQQPGEDNIAALIFAAVPAP